MYNKLSTMLLIAIAFASFSENCLGVRTKDDGFGTTRQVKQIRINSAMPPGTPYFFLGLKNDGTNTLLRVEIMNKDAQNYIFSKGFPVDISFDDGSVITLKTIDDTPPSMGLKSSIYTKWNVWLPLNEEAIKKMKKENIKALRFKNVNETQIIKASKAQSKKFKKLFKCVTCTDC